MYNMKRDALLNDYEIVEAHFYDIQEAWLKHELTTGEAIERHRLLYERMREIRELLLAKTDEEESDTNDMT